MPQAFAAVCLLGVVTPSARRGSGLGGVWLVLIVEEGRLKTLRTNELRLIRRHSERKLMTQPCGEFVMPPHRESTMVAKLSLRRLWILYKRTAVAQGFGSSKRELALAHLAFYSGSRAVLTVLAHMVEHGDSDAAVRTIAQFGRQIKRIQARGPRTRGH